MNNSIYRSKLISFLFIVIVILLSGHALQTIIPKIQYLVFGGVILLIIPTLMNKYIKKLSLYSLPPFLFTLMILLTFVTQFGSGFGYYLTFECIIIFAFGITVVYSFDRFINCFLNIMTVTTFIAIIGYFLVNRTDLLDGLPKMSNINNIEYGIGIIYNYITAIPLRNCGMFWEPGMFATFLTFAIVSELMFRHGKASFLRLALFSIGIFTANSSAGFVLWLLCIILALVKNKNSDKRQNVRKTVFSFVLFVMCLVLLLNIDTIIRQTPLIHNEYIVKLLADNISESSRRIAFSHNLRIFISAPLFGAGITDVSAQMERVADTSTSTYLMSVFGILGLQYTFYWIYGLFKLKNVNLFSKITLVIIFLSIVNKEPHVSILFTWCMLFYILKMAAEPAIYPVKGNNASMLDRSAHISALEVS